MNVYELKSNDDYDCALFNITFDDMFWPRGQSLSSNWIKQHFKWFSEISNDNKKYIKGDLVNYKLSAKVLSEKAYKELADLCTGLCEFLPVNSPEGDRYYLLNITNLLNALDEEKSELEKYSDGSIFIIDEYSYYKDLIKDFPVFKLSNYPSPMLVTDEFVEKVKSSGLTGFEFKKVWEG